jgi:hypothetical protein
VAVSLRRTASGGHLTGIEQEAQAIEDGQGVRAFKIVPAKAAKTDGGAGGNELAASAHVPEDSSECESPAASGGDDDIPF